MPQKELVIRFPTVSPSLAGLNAESLADELRRTALGSDDAVRVVRENPASQDPGTIIVAILGTTAATILARAVRDWAQRKNQAVIELNGVKISNVSTSDVADIVRAIEGE